MSDETTHIGTDHLPPSGYLQPRRYSITCQCNVCGEVYSWETEKLSKHNRECPNPVCVSRRREARTAKNARNMTQMLAEQRPPGHIGDKAVVKAIDTTAEIVMQDYGMTNLQDNVRAGDMVAPKLPAPQQRQADGFFGGAAVQAERAPGNGSRYAELLKARALSGRYRGFAVNPNVTQFGRERGASPLQVIRTEPLQGPGKR